MKCVSNCLYLIVFSFFLVNANAAVNKAGHTLQAAESLSGQIRIPFVRRPGSGDDTFHATALNGRVSVDEGVLKYRLATGADEPVVAFEERFVTGNQPGTRGINPARVTVNYLLGNRENGWQRNLKTFNAIAMDGVWNGVDVRLELNGGHIEKIFSVRPGASIDQIKLQTAGTDQLRINDEHELVVSGAPSSDVSFSAPIAYQEKQGRRVPVEVAYRLYSDDSYGFDVGHYDPSLPLVIDPVLQSTYLGGTPSDDEEDWGSDSFAAIGVHPVSGDVYAAGGTDSVDLDAFTDVGVSELGSIEGSNVLLARFGNSLKTLKQLTVFGGNDSDYSSSLAINPDNGDIYVAGHTLSEDFPGTAGAAQDVFGGADETSGDAFVALFEAGDISAIKQATYIGGSDAERNIGMIRHPSNGDIYISGETHSDDLPATAGGYQETYDEWPHNGNTHGDVFIARLNTDLTGFVQTTYYGAADNGESAFAIAASPNTGDVYIAGLPERHHINSLPDVAGGYRETGAKGIFVAGFDAALSEVRQATYLGEMHTNAPAILVHPQNDDVYVAVHAWATGLPSVADFQGRSDIYIGRFSADLTELTQGTYLGGPEVESYAVLTAHPGNHDIYLAADTSSLDIPEIDGGAIQNPSEAFVSRLNFDDLTQIVQTTYYPGEPGGMSVDPSSGDLLLAGDVFGDDIPLPGLSGAAQEEMADRRDAIVTRITANLEAGDTSPDAFNFKPITGADLNFRVISEPVTISGIDTGVTISVQDGEYSIDDGHFYDIARTIDNGQIVRVRVTSRDRYEREAQATLTVGDHEAAFSVTTKEAPPPPSPGDSNSSSSTATDGGGGGGGGPINVWFMLIGLAWLFKSTRNEPIPRNRG